MENKIKKYQISGKYTLNKFNNNKKNELTLEVKSRSSSQKRNSIQISRNSIILMNLKKRKSKIKELIMNSINQKKTKFNNQYNEEYFKTDTPKFIINKETSTTQYNNSCLFLTINNIKNNFNFDDNSIINTSNNNISRNMTFKNDDYLNTMKPFLENKVFKKFKIKNNKANKEYLKTININDTHEKSLYSNNKRNIINLILNNENIKKSMKNIYNYKNANNIYINESNKEIINKNNKFNSYKNIKEKKAIYNNNNSKTINTIKDKDINDKFSYSKKEKNKKLFKSKNILLVKNDKDKKNKSEVELYLNDINIKNVNKNNNIYGTKKNLRFFKSRNNNNNINNSKKDKNNNIEGINREENIQKKIVVIKKKKKLNCNLNNNITEENNFYCLPEKNYENYNKDSNESNNDIFEIIEDTKIKSLLEYEKEKNIIKLLKENFKSNNNKDKNKEINEKNDLLLMKRSGSKGTFSFRPTNNESEEMSEHDLYENDDIINKNILLEIEEKIKNSLGKPRIKIIRKKKKNNY